MHHEMDCHVIPKSPHRLIFMRLIYTKVAARIESMPSARVGKGHPMPSLPSDTENAGLQNASPVVMC